MVPAQTRHPPGSPVAAATSAVTGATGAPGAWTSLGSRPAKGCTRWGSGAGSLHGGAQRSVMNK